MAIEALIFDVDGTLADTEEAHRQAFNAAFIELELWWDWGPQLYTELLRISGGKERIAHHIESLPVTGIERARLRSLVLLIHSTKTRIYKELVENFRLPARPGVAKLIGDARAAGLCTVVTPTRWNIGQDFSGAQLVLGSLEDIDLPKLERLHAAARATA